jgi:hypothetical protein
VKSARWTQKWNLHPCWTQLWEGQQQTLIELHLFEKCLSICWRVHILYKTTLMSTRVHCHIVITAACSTKSPYIDSSIWREKAILLGYCRLVD